MYLIIKAGYTNASNPTDSTPLLHNTLGTTFLAGNWNLSDNVTSKIQPQLCDKDNQLFLPQPLIINNGTLKTPFRIQVKHNMIYGYMKFNAIREVIAKLLLLSGDVEKNPGPLSKLYIVYKPYAWVFYK